LAPSYGVAGGVVLDERTGVVLGETPIGQAQVQQAKAAETANYAMRDQRWAAAGANDALAQQRAAGADAAGALARQRAAATLAETQPALVDGELVLVRPNPDTGAFEVVRGPDGEPLRPGSAAGGESPHKKAESPEVWFNRRRQHHLDNVMRDRHFGRVTGVPTPAQRGQAQDAAVQEWMARFPGQPPPLGAFAGAGVPVGAAPGVPVPVQPAGQPQGNPQAGVLLQQAREAIAAGRDPAAVRAMLQSMGVDPAGL
jgi:hypothetical protein